MPESRITFGRGFHWALDALDRSEAIGNSEAIHGADELNASLGEMRAISPISWPVSKRRQLSEASGRTSVSR